MQGGTSIRTLYFREHLPCKHAIGLRLSLLEIFNCGCKRTLLAGLSLGSRASIDARIAEVVMAKCQMIREEASP